MNQDLSQAPKQFCDNVLITHGNDFFIMATLSGGSGTVYALTPSHMKNLLKNIEHQISVYEKVHGEIKSNWTPSVPSPIKASDLKKNMNGEEEGEE